MPALPQQEQEAGASDDERRAGLGADEKSQRAEGREFERKHQPEHQARDRERTELVVAAGAGGASRRSRLSVT